VLFECQLTAVGLNLIGFLIDLVVLGVILGIFVWLAGKALGAPKATYYHGILIVVSAIILRDIIGYFISGWVARIVELVVVLVLIRHFFSVGWLKAVVIAILAVVIGIIITAVLAMVGFAFAASTIKGLTSGI
jgi:hypothetical protein